MTVLVLGALLVAGLVLGLGIQALNNRAAPRGSFRPVTASTISSGDANVLADKTFWITGWTPGSGDAGGSFTLHHGLRVKTETVVRLTVRADELRVGINDGALRLYPVREVASVHQKTTQTSLNGKPAETAFLHTITFTDGLSLCAKGEFRDPNRVNRFAAEPSNPELRFAAFVADLDRQIAAVKLPELLSSLRQGSAIAFGDITIDHAGVSAAGRVLPWSAISDVTVDNGRLSITAARHGERIDALIETLPNVHLLIDVLNHQRSLT